MDPTLPETSLAAQALMKTLSKSVSASLSGSITTSAIKFDGLKPDLSLNPRVALEAMAQAFMVGEKKYGRNNYRRGMENHRLVAAALRHIMAFNEGEDLDPEYNTPHLGHALASLAMLLVQIENGTTIDTRPGK